MDKTNNYRLGVNQPVVSSGAASGDLVPYCQDMVAVAPAFFKGFEGVFTGQTTPDPALGSNLLHLCASDISSHELNSLALALQFHFNLLSVRRIRQALQRHARLLWTRHRRGQTLIRAQQLELPHLQLRSRETLEDATNRRVESSDFRLRYIHH